MRDAVVLPVFNEARTVGLVLDAVGRVFDGLIIVVDDGSTDGTQDVLREFSDAVVLRHESNRGYGRSLIDGLHAALSAGAERIVTMDCDGQHEPAHIPTFLDALEDCDIASGSRYLPQSPSVGEAPPDRARVNAAVASVINALTGWGITDAFCGFKAYRAAGLRLLELTEDGYALPVELWAEAWRWGLRVREIAVERIYCDNDRSFGADLDDPEKRLAYYLRVWERSVLRASDPMPREGTGVG